MLNRLLILGYALSFYFEPTKLLWESILRRKISSLTNSIGR